MIISSDYNIYLLEVNIGYPFGLDIYHLSRVDQAHINSNTICIWCPEPHMP